jgi:uncharacterized protein YjbJ (UPF0337 family)
MKEIHMSTQDRASNKVDETKGKIKEVAGRVTDNRDLEGKGKSDQAKASVKNVGEDVKDAVKSGADKVKEIVER